MPRQVTPEMLVTIYRTDGQGSCELIGQLQLKTAMYIYKFTLEDAYRGLADGWQPHFLADLEHMIVPADAGDPNTWED